MASADTAHLRHARWERRRVAVVALAALGALAMVAACGGRYSADDPVTSDDGSAGDAPVQGDGGTPSDGKPSVPDASAIDSASDASSDGGGSCPLPNLLSNPDFENGGVGWLPWNSYVSVLPSAAHSGGGGVQVCRRPQVSEYDADQKFATALPTGTYFARGWFRADPDAGAANGELYMTDQNGYAATIKQLGQLGPKWTCAEVTGTQVVASFGVGGQSAALGTCIDSDDVALYQVPGSGVVPDGCKCPPP